MKLAPARGSSKWTAFTSRNPAWQSWDASAGREPRTHSTAQGSSRSIRRLREPGEHAIYAPVSAATSKSPSQAPSASNQASRSWSWKATTCCCQKIRGGIRGLIDEVWYCETDEQVRLSNLIQRHRAYGRPEQDARSRALVPDQRNAEQIFATRSAADVIARLDGQISPHIPLN